MWARDVLVKFLLFSMVSAFIGIAGLIDALFVLFDKNRQSLHDKIVSTVVVYAPQGLPENMRAQVETYATPAGLATPAAGATIATSIPSASIGDTAERLRELARLRDEGILTPEEYEQRRSELAGQL